MKLEFNSSGPWHKSSLIIDVCVVKGEHLPLSCTGRCLGLFLSYVSLDVPHCAKGTFTISHKPQASFYLSILLIMLPNPRYSYLFSDYCNHILTGFLVITIAIFGQFQSQQYVLKFKSNYANMLENLGWLLLLLIIKFYFLPTVHRTMHSLVLAYICPILYYCSTNTLNLIHLNSYAFICSISFVPLAQNIFYLES